MELWTALILGLAGSAHCAGMCGPLVVAMPAPSGPAWIQLLGRVAYNLGRVATYGVMGLVFGAIGGALAMAGVQRWVSIGLGAVILIGLLVSRTQALTLPISKPLGWLKAGFGPLLRRRTLGALTLLGALNGLLPCGLVYVACAGAAASGGVLQGLQYMVVFGLGTVPMMLALGLAGTFMQASLRLKFQRLVPASLAVVAVLLILRGLSLGIPYLSPDLSGAGGALCCP